MRLPQPVMRRARIEIIPMIDTIFFLLVFFMITWLAMVKMSGLGLTLPRENKTTNKPPESIMLSVAPSGRFYLDSKMTTSSAWLAELRSKLATDPNGTVVVNVAPGQKTQTLVSIIDSVSRTIHDSGSHAQILVASSKVQIDDKDAAKQRR